MYLKPFSSSAASSNGVLSRLCGTTAAAAATGALSRPMQRKLVTLINCQLVEEEGRTRAMRAARSLGERTVTELILQHQNPQQLSANLWAAVRARGCQFLGPGELFIDLFFKPENLYAPLNVYVSCTCPNNFMLV